MAVFGWVVLLLVTLLLAGGMLALAVLGGAFSGRGPSFLDVAIPLSIITGMCWLLYEFMPFTVIVQ